MRPCLKKKKMEKRKYLAMSCRLFCFIRDPLESFPILANNAFSLFILAQVLLPHLKNKLGCHGGIHLSSQHWKDGDRLRSRPAKLHS